MNNEINRNMQLAKTVCIYKKTDLSGNSNRQGVKNIYNRILARLGMTRNEY